MQVVYDVKDDSRAAGTGGQGPAQLLGEDGPGLQSPWPTGASTPFNCISGPGAGTTASNIPSPLKSFPSSTALKYPTFMPSSNSLDLYWAWPAGLEPGFDPSFFGVPPCGLEKFVIFQDPRKVLNCDIEFPGNPGANDTIWFKCYADQNGNTYWDAFGVDIAYIIPPKIASDSRMSWSRIAAASCFVISSTHFSSKGYVFIDMCLVYPFF